MSADRSERPAPRPGLDLIEGYHSPQVDVDVRLNTNESPYPPPEAWRDEWITELRALDAHRYPDRGVTALRAALAEHHQVEPEQVLVGNGSNEVLQALCLAYGGPGRTAVLFEPTYAMHGHIARVCSTTVVEGRRNADFSLDGDEVVATLGRVRPHLTFLCSPNNPTGVVDDPETVMAALDAGPGVLVVDEAYGQFAPWTALELVADDRPLVVTRTFSKTWAMAGLRLGYLVGPAWVVEVLHKVVLPYHLDAAKQAAGLVALRHVDAMNERVAAIVEERGRMVAGLTELPLTVFPSGANFVLVRPTAADGDKVWQALVERSVLVRNCANWPGLEGCLRITVGTPDETDALLGALRDVLQ